MSEHLGVAASTLGIGLASFDSAGPSTVDDIAEKLNAKLYIAEDADPIADSVGATNNTNSAIIQSRMNDAASMDTPEAIDVLAPSFEHSATPQAEGRHNSVEETSTELIRETNVATSAGESRASSDSAAAGSIPAIATNDLNGGFAPDSFISVSLSDGASNGLTTGDAGAFGGNETTDDVGSQPTAPVVNGPISPIANIPNTGGGTIGGGPVDLALISDDAGTGVDNSGGGPVTEDVVDDVVDDVEDVLDDVVDDVEDVLDDVVDDVEGVVDDVVDDVEDVLDDVVDDVEDVVDDVVDDVEDVVDDVVDDVEDVVDDVVDDVEDVLDDVVDDVEDVVADVVADVDDVVADVIATVGDTLGDLLNPGGGAPHDPADTDLVVDLDAVTGGGTIDLADVSITLDPIEDILGDIDIDVDAVADVQPVIATVELVLDTVGDTLGDLLNHGGGAPNDPADTDLVLDLDVVGGGGPIDLTDVSITLDPIEDILGDIDIDVDAVADVQPVIATVELVLDTVGDTLGDLLNHGGGAPHDPADTDLIVDLDAVTGGGTIDLADVSITLDPIEDILGDIDIDVDAVANVQPVIASVGDTLGDLLNHGGGAPNDPADTDLVLDLDVVGGGGPIDLADVSITLDPIEDILGDIDIDVDAVADIQTVIASVGDTLGDLLNHGGGAPQDPADTDLVVDLDAVTGGGTIDLADVSVTLDPIEDILGDIDIEVDAVGHVQPVIATVGDTLGDLLNHGGGAPQDPADTDLVVDLDAITGGGTIDVADVSVTLDPIEDILGDIDIDVYAVAEVQPVIATVGDALGDLLNHGAGAPQDPADTDLVVDLDAVTGGGTIDLADVSVILDPVEYIVGDIDIDVDAVADIQPVIATVGDTLGDLLNHGAGAPQDPADTDLTVDLDAVTGAGTIDVADVSVTLDPVEDIVGDIDLDVDAVADVQPVLDAATPVVGAAHDLLNHGVGAPQDPADTDLTVDLDAVTGTGSIDLADVSVALDPVEDIVGDIDLDVDAVADVQPVLDAATPVVGAVDDLLNHGAGAPQDPADTDLTIDIDVVTGADTIDVADVSVTLDPVENLLGDIDIDLQAMTDIDATELDNAFAVTTDSAFGQPLDTAGGFDLSLLDDDAVAPGVESMAPVTIAIEIPEVMGSISEGLGAVLDHHSSHHSGFSGLF